MNSRNAQIAVRSVLAVACAVMALSLLAQLGGAASAGNALRRTAGMKKKLQPLSAVAVKPLDLSGYSDLQKSHLFGAPPGDPGAPPPPQVESLFGGMAMVGGKWFGEGDDVNGWKIVKIADNAVVAKRENQEQRLPFRDEREELTIDNRGQGPQPGMPMPGGKGGPGGPRPGGAPPSMPLPPDMAQAGGGPGGGGPVVITLGGDSASAMPSSRSMMSAPPPGMFMGGESAEKVIRVIRNGDGGGRSGGGRSRR